MSVHWIDIAALILVSVGIYRGIKNGFIKEAAAIIGLLAGIWAGFRLAFLFADYYKTNFHLPEKTIPVFAFVTAFVMALGLVLTLGYLLRSFLERTNLSFPDKAAGGLFGGLKMVFLCGTVLSLFLSSRIFSAETKKSSMTLEPLTDFSKGMNEYTVALIPQAGNMLEKIDSFFPALEATRNHQQDSTANGSDH